jgi:hypothetical protein
VVVVVDNGPLLSGAGGGTVLVCCSIVPFLFHVVVVVVCGGCAVSCETVGAGNTVVVVSLTWRPPHPTNINADKPTVANATEAFLSFINNPLGKNSKLLLVLVTPAKHTVAQALCRLSNFSDLHAMLTIATDCGQRRE